MDFGILFTSQPNLEIDDYPYDDLHKRITGDILLADELGYDTAWLAEHHFSDKYGIMPDVMTYAAYLAPQTRRIRLGTGVVVLPLNNPVRVVENACFIDQLSGGRFVLGLGSGYRQYEFDGMGIDFEGRRDVQAEAIEIVLDLFHEHRTTFAGKAARADIKGDFELFPHAAQKPFPPLYMAVGSEQSMKAAASHGFGIMLSSLPGTDVLAEQAGRYRSLLAETKPPYDRNPAMGDLLLNRFVYVAETDDKARKESEQGVLRHLAHFMTQGNYMTTVDSDAGGSGYDELLGDVLLHGSPETVADMLAACRDATGMTGIILHYPPYYGPERIRDSLTLFAEEVIPRFRDKDAEPAAARGAAE